MKFHQAASVTYQGPIFFHLQITENTNLVRELLWKWSLGSKHIRTLEQHELARSYHYPTQQLLIHFLSVAYPTSKMK